jgi:hypothetical protein
MDSIPRVYEMEAERGSYALGVLLAATHGRAVDDICIKPSSKDVVLQCASDLVAAVSRYPWLYVVVQGVLRYEL